MESTVRSQQAPGRPDGKGSFIDQHDIDHPVMAVFGAVLLVSTVGVLAALL